MIKIVVYGTMVLIVLLLFALQLQSNKISNISDENNQLNNQLSAQQIITKATLSTVTLFHQISLDNIKAKQLEDSEHVKVKTVIKTVLKDNECANTAVPDVVISELQQQERNIRSRSANTYSSTLDK